MLFDDSGTVIDRSGDIMKKYEQESGCDFRFPDGLPVIVRLDGRAFHTFTRGLERPYDARLSEMMLETTKALMLETNATVGYTQSDEISLLLEARGGAGSQLLFAGRRDKLISVLASIATARFNQLLDRLPPTKITPVFDGRAFSLPDRMIAVDYLLWREEDAFRNSIQMLAQATFPTRELHRRSCNELLAMLRERGIEWRDRAQCHRHGQYVKFVRTHEPFTAEEIEALPPKHMARTMKSLLVERRKLVVLNMPTGLHGAMEKGYQAVLERSEDPLSGYSSAVNDLADATSVWTPAQ